MADPTPTPTPADRLLTALADLLSGQTWLTIKPRDPERAMARGGVILKVERSSRG